MTKLTVYCR